MNLCVETAPNVLTTPWEVGAIRQWGLGFGWGLLEGLSKALPQSDRAVHGLSPT